MNTITLAILALLTVVSVNGAEKQEALFANQRFTVVSKGLAFAVCDTFDSNMFAVKMPTLPNVIVNNVATHSTSNPFDSGGLFGRCNGVMAESLNVGEVVTATGSTVHGREFRLRIVSSPHAIRRGIGAFEHTTYESGAAELRFKLTNPKDRSQIETALRAWLRPSNDAAGNTASGVQVPHLQDGMTVVQVEATVGPPDLKFDSEGLTTYTYKSLGVVVVFKDGLVTKIIGARQ
jgi:hypothetical protein